MMIYVYAMDTGGKDYTAEEWKGCLTEERLCRASRLRTEEQRRLFLGAELLLNRSLERIKAPVPLPAVYTRNLYGKPYLTDAPDLYVNWSHSGTYVICVLADREAGIDLQNTRKAPKDSLVRRMLQPEERLFYDRAETEQKKRLFYEYWTLKESFLKALGTGFQTSLDTFYICMEGTYPEVVPREGKESYTCRLLDFADEDYAAAVCLEGSCPDLGERPAIEYITI